MHPFLRTVGEQLTRRRPIWLFHFDKVSAEMSKAMAGIVDVSELASLLCQRLPEIVHRDGAALLLSQSTGGLAVATTVAPVSVSVQALAPDGVIAGELLRSSRPMTTAELATRLDGVSIASEERRLLDDSFVDLWVPLVKTGASRGYLVARLQGVLLLGKKTSRRFTQRAERRLIGALAWQAAVAAENVELVTALKERAEQINDLYADLVQVRERERKRLARELHDQIIQDLVDLLYLPESSVSESKGPLEWHGRLRRTIDAIRGLCAALRPSALDDLSLTLALQGHIEEVKREHGLLISFRVPDEDDDGLDALSEELKLSLFRVLQEALTNVRRHARAHRIDVRLSSRDTEVALSVVDDGCGFVCPRDLGQLVRQGRYGLAGAHERLQSVGGALAIESSGRGTRVLAVVPRRRPRRSDSARGPDQEFVSTHP